MSLQLLNFEGFINYGGFIIVGGITLILLVIQAMIAYVMWKRGEREYLRRLISYIFAIISVFFILLSITTFWHEFYLFLGLFMFGICIIIALAIPVYIEIRDTWIKKEEGSEIQIKKEEKT